MADYPAAGRETRQINIKVSERVFAQLQKAGETAGMSATAYGKVLFDAAYSARCKPTGDLDLDAQVSAALILHGSGMDFETISRALHCSEERVERIVGAWFARDEAA